MMDRDHCRSRSRIIRLFVLRDSGLWIHNALFVVPTLTLSVMVMTVDVKCVHGISIVWVTVMALHPLSIIGPTPTQSQEWCLHILVHLCYAITQIVHWFV